MQTTLSARKGPVTRNSSLVESISTLRFQFASMKSELSDAHSEIVRLNDELNQLRDRVESLRELDVASLRRELAFYCHPDRGGDAGVMSRLNVLFDLLNITQQPSFEVAGGGSGA